MGEKQNGPFQLSFNTSLKVDFQGSRVTSDCGLILVRELDERLGFGELIAQHLTDSRRGKNTQLPLIHPISEEGAVMKLYGCMLILSTVAFGQIPHQHHPPSSGEFARGTGGPLPRSGRSRTRGLNRRGYAFRFVANHCSAAQAECLARIRKTVYTTP
jgi:hypothetical protein